MDASDRSRISSSAPIKRSSIPKSSSSATGTDENELSYQQMGISLQNSKKPMTKHFMSPTISASSKAIAPRKKVLAERNENADNSDLSVNVDSSLSPYDPLTNYPSPRPKFLRYKPNRRREIFLRCENEANGSISLPCKKDENADFVCVSQEGEELDEGEGEVEEEEEEEEKEGFLRRVLKLMLVLALLVSSTMYISFMNSPKASPTLQAMEDFKDGYLKIYDHAYGAMRRLGGEDHLLKLVGLKEILKKFEIGNEFLDIHMGLMTVNQTVILGECIEEELAKDFHFGSVEETSDNLGEVVELEAGEREHVSDHGTTKTEEISDQMFENFELKGTESIDKAESLLDNQMPTVSNAFDPENEQVIEPVPEVNSVEVGAGEMVEIGMTNIENDEAGEVSMIERVDNEISSFEILNFEAEGELKEGLAEPIETDTMFETVIGVTMVFAIIAPLALAFHRKGKWNATKDASPIIKPCITQSGVAERCGYVLPNEREEQIKRVDPFVSPPVSSISSTMEDSEDIIQSRAPAVELLGEFVVGEISSSFRNRAMKGKMEESEVSNYSVSLDKGFGSSSVLYHAPLDFSELSFTNISLSHEDFTPQKKTMKKEDGRYGEANNVSTTPVRRSSRIRNRAVTSP
ncbi:hypothetical protein WN944_021954 [Citrus x changshan-huyou]|uniref:Uncharacterized protein n=1 Tax=Citrus x changshan-huyou TaxID=2935761 RepID=A0AAP0N0T5_9ROSI